MSRKTLTITLLLATTGARAEHVAGQVAKRVPALPAATTPVSRVTFVAFDTETTGLDAVRDRIVEIGAVKFAGGRVLETRQWLVNPRRRIPYWAEQVHGITTEMVKDAPPFEEVYPQFEAFARDAVLIAHNARFDIGFLSEELKRHRLPSPGFPVLDSLRLFRLWFPEARSHSLEPLAAYAGIESGRFHRALEDSVYVAELFHLVLRRRDEEGFTFDRLLDEAREVLTW